MRWNISSSGTTEQELTFPFSATMPIVAIVPEIPRRVTRELETPRVTATALWIVDKACSEPTAVASKFHSSVLPCSRLMQRRNRDASCNANDARNVVRNARVLPNSTLDGNWTLKVKIRGISVWTCLIHPCPRMVIGDGICRLQLHLCEYPRGCQP